MDILKFLNDGSGYGSGSGDGYGYGSGSGDGSGYGYGSGYGSGSGYGYGSGSGDGYGIKSINGEDVHMVDGVQTIIRHIRGDVAKGFIVNGDLTFAPCFVVKGHGMFSHGDTIESAMLSLEEKILENTPVEERIDEFKKRFPQNDKLYKNADFFNWHGKLTGSCQFGRESFARDHIVDLNGEMTVQEFVALTEHAYGGSVIAKLK